MKTNTLHSLKYHSIFTRFMHPFSQLVLILNHSYFQFSCIDLVILSLRLYECSCCIYIVLFFFVYGSLLYLFICITAAVTLILFEHNFKLNFVRFYPSHLLVNHYFYLFCVNTSYISIVRTLEYSCNVAIFLRLIVSTRYST